MPQKRSRSAAGAEPDRQETGEGDSHGDDEVVRDVNGVEPYTHSRGALDRLSYAVNLGPVSRATRGFRSWMGRHRYFTLSLLVIFAAALGLALIGTPSTLDSPPGGTNGPSWLTLFGLIRQLVMVTLAIVLLGWRFDWLARGMTLVGIEPHDIDRLQASRFWYLGGYLLLEGFLLW